MGHSQGGMIMRLPLRFWPDTRDKVAEVIGFAGSNHGSDGTGSCDAGCAEALFQQGANSNFIAALNSRTESFERISYTEIFTNNDAVVTPPPSAGISGPGKILNIAVQEICPESTADHLSIGTTDPVAAALALDALNHPGPAKASRINAAVCAEQYQPGFDPATGFGELALAAAQLGNSYATAPTVSGEPQLRCWTLKAQRKCSRAAHHARG
jgi:hypothetical protein